MKTTTHDYCWFLILMGFNMADAFGTLVLVLDGAHEQNPIWAWVLDNGAVYFIPIKFAMGFLLGGWLLRHLPRALPWVSFALMVICVMHAAFITWRLA